MTEWLRLRHIAETVTSNVDKLKSDNEIPVRLINYTDVYYGDRLTPDLPLMLATASASEIARHRVADGDVLITKDSETADDIGVAAYVESTSQNLVCGYHLSRIRAHRPTVHPRYLFWALTGSHARDQMRVAATGVTRFGLRADSIRDLAIRVPALGEQRAIADYLDTETGHIDALISKKRRMIELLEERWVAEVVNATTSSGGNGSRVALRRVVDSTIGGAWGKNPGEGDLEALCIRGTDFDTVFLTADNDSAPIRSFSYEEFQRRQLLDGDLVIEKSGGGDKQPVGRAVQWQGDDAGVPTNFAARLRPADGVDSRFLAFLFRASYETGVTRRWIKQTTGIQNLDLGGFLSEKYAIPLPHKQSSIAERLDEATEHRSLVQDKLHTQIRLLVERRQALITAAVTGELAVQGGVE